MTQDETRAALKGQNLTKLAELSGVSRRTLIRLRGDSSIKTEVYTLMRIEKALKRLGRSKRSTAEEGS